LFEHDMNTKYFSIIASLYIKKENFMNAQKNLCKEELASLPKETLLTLIDLQQSQLQTIHHIASNMVSSITSGQMVQSRFTTAEMMVIIEGFVSKA